MKWKSIHRLISCGKNVLIRFYIYPHGLIFFSIRFVSYYLYHFYFILFTSKHSIHIWHFNLAQNNSLILKWMIRKIPCVNQKSWKSEWIFVYLSIQNMHRTPSLYFSFCHLYYHCIIDGYYWYVKLYRFSHKTLICKYR